MTKCLCTVMFCVFLLLAAKPSFAAGGSCPSGKTIDANGNPISLQSLGITNCFYISKSAGSDSNSGTSEDSPWQHLPGMKACTNTCSSTKPAAGEGFILKGGDTWTGSDLTETWSWSGTSTNPIYVGVDQSWWNASVCGSGWCRPIFQGGFSGNMVNAGGTTRWWIFDNIEMKGLTNEQNGYLVQGAQNVRITQNYFHGWTQTGDSNNVGFFSQGGAGSMADHNVIDGSDSSQNTLNGFYASWSQIQYNYIAYVVSAVLGSTDSVHDNTVLHTVTSATGDHCNGIFTFDPLSGTKQLIYNNYINNGNACPGGVVLWFNGNGDGNSNWSGFGFNNVMWGLSSNPVNIGNHQTTNYGTYYWFNNTVDCSLGGCGGHPGAGYWQMYDNNNHVVSNALQFDTTSFGGPAPIPCNQGIGSGCTDLTQTESQANGQGYKSNETPPYSPTSSCTPSTCKTVQAGTNLASTYCSNLSSIDASAGAACLLSSSVGVAYDSTNHIVTGPGVMPITRPSSGAWDIGAYQFGSQQQQQSRPRSPTGLAAKVQ